jgi:hypothetical protein
MLAELTTNGGNHRPRSKGRRRLLGFTFTASGSAAGYNVTLVFPYSANFTKFEEYATYGDEAKRLPFKYNPGGCFHKGRIRVSLF